MIIQFFITEISESNGLSKAQEFFNLPMWLRHPTSKGLTNFKMHTANARLYRNLFDLKLNMPDPQISEFQALLIATPIWRDTLWVLAARWVQLCHTQAPYLDNKKQTSKAMNSVCLLRLFTSISSPLFKLLQQHYSHYSLQCYNQGQVAFCPSR